MSADPSYMWAVIAALQGIITQHTTRQPEYITGYFVCRYVGTGRGVHRYRATSTTTDPDWVPVAEVRRDGTVVPLEAVHAV